MAKCDEGYLCDVCGEEVEGLLESDLYLRYVVGMIDPETLHTTPERHIACNPALAQFILAPEFEHVDAGEFGKQQLDEQFVRQRETLLTRGWRRLQELNRSEGVSLLDYPLPEFRHSAS